MGGTCLQLLGAGKEGRMGVGWGMKNSLVSPTLGVRVETNLEKHLWGCQELRSRAKWQRRSRILRKKMEPRIETLLRRMMEENRHLWLRRGTWTKWQLIDRRQKYLDIIRKKATLSDLGWNGGATQKWENWKPRRLERSTHGAAKQMGLWPGNLKQEYLLCAKLYTFN